MDFVDSMSEVVDCYSVRVQIVVVVVDYGQQQCIHTTQLVISAILKDQIQLFKETKKLSLSPVQKLCDRVVVDYAIERTLITQMSLGTVNDCADFELARTLNWCGH